MSLFILRDQILVIYNRFPKRSLSLLILVYAFAFEWFRRTGFVNLFRIWRRIGLL